MFEATSTNPENYKEKEGYKITCEALQCVDDATEKIEFNPKKCGISDVLLCKRCKQLFENLNEYQISQIKTKQNWRD